MIKVYQGSCHCGLVKFEISALIDHVRECNCTICSKRGSLNFRVPLESLKLHTPLDKLSRYQWGSKTAEDYFCPKCGVLPFRKPSQLTKTEIKMGKKPFLGWAVNVRCLNGINLAELPVVKINGLAL